MADGLFDDPTAIFTSRSIIQPIALGGDVRPRSSLHSIILQPAKMSSRSP